MQDRPGPGIGKLPEHRIHPPGRGRIGSGSDPSRVRIPQRERRFRRGLRRGRHQVHRPPGGSDPLDGRQDPGAGDHDGCGRACGAGHVHGRQGRRRGCLARIPDRLSGHAQGRCRRGRQGHAAGRGCREPRQLVEPGTGRGREGIRRRHGLHREGDRPTAARRSPGAGGRARRGRASGRARVQHPAPSPEGPRGIPFPAAGGPPGRTGRPMPGSGVSGAGSRLRERRPRWNS